ncbi:ABC transporter substrate-binding protein [Enterococcus alcedinis]|uniref:ABC transporter substrate-binding protein n=1 Tax=Enterococcus alcedinis TaxID=1274384 RepID=A0A917N3R9_9ENTE|nr:tryptophan ABC transporter substrate-binding protein [Enterococcus alcedinis]MBP2100884.1 putative ABC transport system substrate-binding protein [Enterococcus alcedinis]GGI64818.1 ABC transporter substrate-binding protein [Enterococcus alcedinis]
MFKNKGFMITVGVLFIALIAGFLTQGGNKGQTTTPKSDTSAVEQEKKVYKVGLLQFVSHPALDQITEGVKAGLKENGFIEGENLEIIFQNGQADQSKLNTMSQQLINEGSEILIGIATPAAQALANQTKKLPIILGAVTDPVGSGLISDMENPGGNITGVSDKAPVLEQLKLAQTLMPDAKKMGILFSSSEDNSKYQVAEAVATAKELGLTVEEFSVPSTNEVSQVVQVMAKKVDFMYIPLDNTIANAMPAVVNEANKLRLPIITSADTMVAEGGLATIGINQFAIGLEAGKMAASVLKGESETATTPVYTFTKGDLILNEKQAKFLNIEIPEKLKETAIMVGGE